MMNLNILSAERKLYFLRLVKTGQIINHPIDGPNSELVQMAKAGYLEAYDTMMPGRIVFCPTQALREIVASWDETALRRQIEADIPSGPVGGLACGAV